ncbi:phosphate-starvation-inducible PsiE family protein [Acidiphilium sp.]|uniref:phosphate-starvation-inducible PsiE family protein n=1 Tax=Acidiphilium sp. TaxID=527 RepID=UPI003CFC7DDC
MRAGLETRIYHYFEIVVVQVLTLLMAVVVTAALLHLILNIVHDILFTSFDPTNPAIFQSVFGAIFTVVIALEFKRSILVTSERAEGLVRVRVVILIGMLAIVRKLIILDLGKGESLQLFALSAAFLSLGAVYWLVRDQDRRDQADRVE